MATLLQALYEGIINGTIYALIAMGIALVWGVMGILSFSQGEFLMIAMFVAYFFSTATGLPPVLAPGPDPFTETDHIRTEPCACQRHADALRRNLQNDPAHRHGRFD